MVTAADAKSVIYFERMDQLSSWMRHYRFEISLRRRTRRFFKQFYATRSAIDERSILENLAPQLQEAVSSYLLHTFVKTHPLFRNLPEGTLWKVLTIVRTIHFEADHSLIQVNSPSSALFILLSGTCACTVAKPGEVLGPGAPRSPRRAKHAPKAGDGTADDDGGGGDDDASPKSADATLSPPRRSPRLIGPGASFGELCLLGVRSSSLVDVRTLTNVECFLVQRDSFLDSFANLPEILGEMMAKRTLFLKHPIRLPPKRRVPRPPSLRGANARASIVRFNSGDTTPANVADPLNVTAPGGIARERSPSTFEGFGLVRKASDRSTGSSPA